MKIIRVLGIIPLLFILWMPFQVSADSHYDACASCPEGYTKPGLYNVCLPSDYKHYFGFEPSSSQIGYCPNRTDATFITAVDGTFNNVCVYEKPDGTREEVAPTPVTGLPNPGGFCSQYYCKVDGLFSACRCYPPGSQVDNDTRVCNANGDGSLGEKPTAGCGNTRCEPELGETIESCPGDCGDTSNFGQEEQGDTKVTKNLTPEEACSIAEDEPERIQQCISCTCPGPVNPRTGLCELGIPNVWTEFGCIAANTYGTSISALRIGIGVITGVAVLRLIQAGIMYSSGDPEQVKEAKSITIAAMAAVGFLAACVLLLQFAGVTILGFGELADYYSTT